MHSVAADAGPTTMESHESLMNPSTPDANHRARRRIVLGEGGLWGFLGPLAWIVAALLLGDLFPDGLRMGGEDDWLPLLRASFLLVGCATFLGEAGRFERWIFDLEERTLTWRHGLIDLKPRQMRFATLDRVRIVVEERGPEDYLVAVHMPGDADIEAEAFACGRGLPEEAEARAKSMQRLLDEVRRRSAEMHRSASEAPDVLVRAENS